MLNFTKSNPKEGIHSRQIRLTDDSHSVIVDIIKDDNSINVQSLQNVSSQICLRANRITFCTPSRKSQVKPTGKKNRRFVLNLSSNKNK